MHIENVKTDNIQEHQVLDLLSRLEKTSYPGFLARLQYQPVFTNIANCMDAFKKYFVKSKSFGRLFYANFAMLAFLLLLGLTRIFTGLLREKPVTFIFVTVIVLTVFIVMYLWRLTKLVGTTTLPNFYREHLINEEEKENNWQWQYFLTGKAALTISLVLLVEATDRNTNSMGDSSSGSSSDSSDSSCGSSGGSSCGGCGGGD